MKRLLITILTALTLLFAVGCGEEKAKAPETGDNSEIVTEGDDGKEETGEENGSGTDGSAPSEGETPEDENGGTWTEDVLLPSADNK